MAKKYAAHAPNFKTRGAAKEFITKRGLTFLVLGFGDPEGFSLVLRKVRGTNGASANFKPLPNRRQKEILRKLGGRGNNTYEVAWSLLG